MMSVEPGIVDANVLAYATNADVPNHAASLTLSSAIPLCQEENNALRATPGGVENASEGERPHPHSPTMYLVET